jgi:hypothetical protein
MNRRRMKPSNRQGSMSSTGQILLVGMNVVGCYKFFRAITDSRNQPVLRRRGCSQLSRTALARIGSFQLIKNPNLGNIERRTKGKCKHSVLSVIQSGATDQNAEVQISRLFKSPRNSWNQPMIRAIGSEPLLRPS